MQHAINDFRRANGRSIVYYFDGLVSRFCSDHCWAMVHAGYIYHAPAHYLQDWSEAVYECTYHGQDIHTLAKQILEEHFDDAHKRIVLDSAELAYGYAIHNYKFYLTIRGR